MVWYFAEDCMPSQRFIHLIADYGLGDPSFGEVIQRLTNLLPEATIHPTSVPAFDTLATGFWIYQYAFGEHPKGMAIFANTAPRKDNKQPRRDNEGEGLMYALLENGVEVMAVNSGYCFSFVRPQMKKFHAVLVRNKGSQFRSRDFYPQVFAKHLNGGNVLGKSVDPSVIPDIPKHQIAWVDGYGNIKTTVRQSALKIKPGTKVKVAINGVKRTALVVGGVFSVAEGELSLSPGSSGHGDRFCELILRGGSAALLFDYPKIGSVVKFS